jgi:TRAP-type C4-dicarboxylate transport system substrate-binding protein
VADISFVPPSFYAGTLPWNTVTQLPYWTTALEGARVYRRVMAACPELSQELMRYGVRPLVVTSISQYDVGTVKKPVRSPEDLKNLKLKTSGGLFDKIAKQYGIIPVVVPSPEIYEATQRGIIDGNILSFPSVKGYRVNELEKYHTFGLRMGGYPALWTINEKKWQKIPEDLRKALLKVSEEFSDYSANSWDEEQVNLVQQFEKEGMVIYRPAREDRAKWEAPLKGIEEIWIQDMEKKGLSARKVFAEFSRSCGEVVR